MARRSRRRRSSASKANPRSYSGLHTRTQHEPPENKLYQRANVGRDRASQSQQQSAASDQTPESVRIGALHSPNQVNWKTEYSKVFSDLKQLLIVSVALFGLMLALGFFL